MVVSTAGDWQLQAELLDQTVLAVTTTVSEGQAKFAAAEETNRVLDAALGELRGQAGACALHRWRSPARSGTHVHV